MPYRAFSASRAPHRVQSRLFLLVIEYPVPGIPPLLYVNVGAGGFGGFGGFGGHNTLLPIPRSCLGIAAVRSRAMIIAARQRVMQLATGK